MSEMDMDVMPRMRDYLKPEDLDTDACVALAAQVLKDAADDLTTAARQAAAMPSKGNMGHLKNCRAFYESDLFTALSCGLADGPATAQKIIKDALRGRKAGGEEA